MLEAAVVLEFREKGILKTHKKSTGVQIIQHGQGDRKLRVKEIKLEGKDWKGRKASYRIFLPL